MNTFDIAVVFAVLSIIVLALAWFFALPEWRRLRTAHRLEMHEFFRRQGCETPRPSSARR